MMSEQISPLNLMGLFIGVTEKHEFPSRLFLRVSGGDWDRWR